MFFAPINFIVRIKRICGRGISAGGVVMACAVFMLVSGRISRGQLFGSLRDELNYEEQLREIQQRQEDLEAMQKLSAKINEGRGQFNAQIAAGRKAFWDAYPDKPGFASAKKQFADLLAQKDMFYLQFEFQTMMMAPKNVQQGDVVDAAQTFGLTQMITQGGLDGGIPREGLLSFYRWAEAMRKSLYADKNEPLGAKLADVIAYWTQQGDKFKKALADKKPLYDAYVVDRDWAEFDMSGREPAGSNNPIAYGMIMMTHFEKISPTEAKSEILAMVNLMGEDAVKAAAAKVRAAPKDDIGRLKDPEALGLWDRTAMLANGMPDETARIPAGYVPTDGDRPLEAMEILAGKDDAKRFMMDLLAQSSPKIPSEDDLTWKKYDWGWASRVYSHLLAAFGDKTMLAAAEKVRSAPKRQFDGELADAKSIGTGYDIDVWAFFDILARSDPRGYVRAILCAHGSLTSPSNANSEYQKFVSAHGGEKAVLDAAQKLIDRKSVWPQPETAGDYDALARVLSGGPAIVEVKPKMSVPGGKPNPQYLAWAKFSPGTTVTYVTKEWLERDGTVYPESGITRGMISFRTFKLTALDEDKATVAVMGTEYCPPRTTRIGGVLNATAVFTPVHDAGSTKYAALESNAQKDDSAGVMDLRLQAQSEILRQRGGRGGMLQIQVQENDENGVQTIETLGKELACQFHKRSFPTGWDTVWRSDQVPGGLVQETTFKPQDMPGSGTDRGVLVQVTWVIPTIPDLGDLASLPELKVPVAPSSAMVKATPGESSKAMPAEPSVSAPANKSTAAGMEIVVRTVDPITLDEADGSHDIRATVVKASRSPDGKTIIPEGAEIFLNATQTETNRPGYVRITLSTDYAVVDGRQIHVKGIQLTQAAVVAAARRQVMASGRLVQIRLSEPLTIRSSATQPSTESTGAR